MLVWFIKALVPSSGLLRESARGLVASFAKSNNAKISKDKDVGEIHQLCNA
jgi:hypothetical protein